MLTCVEFVEKSFFILSLMWFLEFPARRVWPLAVVFVDSISVLPALLSTDKLLIDTVSDPLKEIKVMTDDQKTDIFLPHPAQQDIPD